MSNTTGYGFHTFSPLLSFCFLSLVVASSALSSLLFPSAGDRPSLLVVGLLAAASER